MPNVTGQAWDDLERGIVFAPCATIASERKRGALLEHARLLLK